MRFALEVVEAVRAEWPADRPLFFRVSALDGSGGGWTMDDTVVLSHRLYACGVDVIDCSSGGMTGPTPTMVVPRDYGFQVAFAERVRGETDAMGCAVGLIVDPGLADAIIREGRADLVAIGREALNNPNWPHHAREALSQGIAEDWPVQVRGWLERRAATIAVIEAGKRGGK